MCLISFINNFGVDVLPDNISEKLKEIVLKDSDVATKRNAFLVLSKLDPKESLLVTKEILHNNDINELADLFTMALVENLKALCTIFPREKSKILKLLIDFSNHKSHSVLFEIGTSLISLSSNPHTIRTSVNILCNLLQEQKDNNKLIVILKKLIEVKNKYRDILEEQILSFVIILDSGCTTELRKLLFELISELIRESNISKVFEIFISNFNKFKNVNETELITEFKNMILMCMYRNIKKFPSTINKIYPTFLLEKCLLYDSKNSFTDNQILIIRDLFYIFPQNFRDEFLNKIINSFEDITSSEIMQTCIWILAEYSSEIKTIKKAFDLIMKNIGDLSLVYSEKIGSEELDPQKLNEKKVITKTIILPDGTYGTQTIQMDSSEYNKQKDNKFLRKFILETNFFFSTNLVVAITRMVVNLYYLDIETRENFNTYFYNTLNIICAILKLESEKIFKDPDNVSRIIMCLEFLTKCDFDQFSQWINESRAIYDKHYQDVIGSLSKDKNYSNKKKKVDFDESINFRHVKPYDPENFDIIEDETNEESLDHNKNEDSIKKNKFIEVLTGSDVSFCLLL